MYEPAEDAGLARGERLRSRRDYERLAHEGRRVASAHFVVSAARRAGTPEDERPRLGVTVSRRVGKAVVRNRVKRRVREVFRTRRALLPGLADVVVIARPGAGDLSAAEVDTELANLFAKVEFS